MEHQNRNLYWNPTEHPVSSPRILIHFFFFVKQRPQPSIGPGGKTEARSLPQDGEFSGGRGHRCGSTPAWRRFVHIQSWPEPATHCSLALKGEQYVPGIQMPHVNRKEALMDGGATMRNGSMYHLTWYWHSHSERRPSRGLIAWAPASPVRRTFPQG